MAKKAKIDQLQTGKGDKPRPMTISREEYGKRFENIFGKKDKNKEKDG